MPMYSYLCPKCSREFEELIPVKERNNIKCCGIKANRKINKLGKTFLFQEGWWNDIGEKPLYINSKKQLKEECNKYGCISNYLEG